MPDFWPNLLFQICICVTPTVVTMCLSKMFWMWLQQKVRWNFLDHIKFVVFDQADGEDDLKKLQLMELAIMNGTYRDNTLTLVAAPRKSIAFHSVTFIQLQIGLLDLSMCNYVSLIISLTDRQSFTTMTGTSTAVGL